VKAAIGLAVPGWLIRSLVAGDRNAERRPRPDGTGAASPGVPPACYNGGSDGHRRTLAVNPALNLELGAFR